MNTVALSAVQQRTLRFVQTCIAERSLPPTRAEIAQHMGWRSANAAEEILQRLAKAGMIQLQPHTSRGITLPADTAEARHRRACTIVSTLLDKGIAHSTWAEKHPDAYRDLVAYRKDMVLSVEAQLNTGSTP